MSSIHEIDTGRHPKIVLPEQPMPILVNGMVETVQEAYSFLDKRAASVEKAARGTSRLVFILVLMLILQIADLAFLAYVCMQLVK